MALQIPTIRRPPHAPPLPSRAPARSGLLAGPMPTPPVAAPWAGPAAGLPPGLPAGGGAAPGGGGGLLGRLGGIASDPLVALGTGLLGASGYSTMPVTLGQAIGAGAQNMQRAGLLNMRQQMAEAQMEEIQRKREAAEAAAQQQAAQREAQVGLLTDVLGSRERAETVYDAGIGAQFLKPQEPAELPASVRTAEWWRDASPEDRAALAAVAEATRAPGVSITNMPGPTFRSTPGGGTALVYTTPAGETAVQQVIPGEETAPAREKRKIEDARSDFERLVDEYGGMASSAGLWGETEAKAGQLRREIAEKIARMRQPTGILTDADIRRAELDVPDIGGPIDAPRAKALLDNLKRLHGAKVDKPKATASRSREDILKQYGVQ